MSRLMPDLSRWTARQWAMIISLLLAITLTPLAWIQWQQYRMLEDLSGKQVDSIMWQAYQLEREARRLQEALIQADTDAGGADAFELSDRFEIFLSRIDLLTGMPRNDLLSPSAEYTQAMEQVGAFTEFAEPLFQKPQSLIDDKTQRMALLQRIAALTVPLGDLTREANRAVARFVDERNHQLRQQGILVASLAAAQIVILLLFVGLLIQHIRRQQRQYTTLKTLSQDLEVAKTQAEQANHGKSIFLANMSHEIRTPFQGLLGMLGLLDDASLNGQQRDYLQTARDSALHLLGVLNDILDVSTLESGTLKLSPGPVHLPSLVQEVNSLMQVAARDKGLSLHMHAADDLPVWIMADATRVRQIMFNLINNAIKFTLKGSVKVELAKAPSGTHAIELKVCDTGIGMDEATLGQLFTRFYQADNSLRRRIGGTGLGLEISRNLARMMGGDIRAESQPGIGSTFIAELQLAPTQPPHREAIASEETDEARSLKILVAEDHPINLKYMSILLEKMGHAAVFCENGEEAIQLLERTAFDVLLLDFHMPVLDGLATTERIRQLPGAAAETKIILVTADVVNDTRKRALDVGVNEFASKPLQMADLQSALARCGLLDADETVQTSNTRAPFVSTFADLMAADLPSHAQDAETQILNCINEECYGEILQMMPEDSLEELLKTVFDAPDGTVHVLASAIEAADREAIGYNAHKLKGTAMLMGFRALVKTATLLEHLATQTEDPIATEMIDQLLRDAALTQTARERFAAMSTP
jgi:two-component system, sensor histidine kinase